jgi:sulfate adenylyltransferase subunit 1 (EFTu-like GTPase family)
MRTPEHCGSRRRIVDDGKSTLIGAPAARREGTARGPARGGRASLGAARRPALDLSLFTDGLTLEREQGITIDVAYRYFATPARRFIIADTPGHEQYTRNMVTGAAPPTCP